MLRTQVSLTEQQMARLRAEALRQGISVAAVVRRAVDAALRGPDWDGRRRRALTAIGAIDGMERGAEEHDALLADIYGR